MTQWQVWHRPHVRQMLAEIEDRSAHKGARRRWYKAILGAVPRRNTELGLSEFTLYATWTMSRHRQAVQLISSRALPWLRDPPMGVLNHSGLCCPSPQSLCECAVAGFHFVSWECTHQTKHH